jgi:hypothetical protein
MNRTTIVVALACTIAAAAPASADFKDDAKAAAKTAVKYGEVAAKYGAIAGEITVATGNRVRRSIAFGPHAGTYVGSTFGTGNELVTGVTWGMALYTFKIPTILDIDKLLQAQLEIAIRDEATRIIAEGGTPDLEAIGRKAYANLKEDIMGKIRPRILERPKLGVIVEGIAQLQPRNAIGARLSATYGIGPISLGLGGGFLRGDGNTTAFVGPEVSLRLTPWGKSWTPVIDVYLRADTVFDVFDDRERAYVATLGGRMLLDLI